MLSEVILATDELLTESKRVTIDTEKDVDSSDVQRSFEVLNCESVHVTSTQDVSCVRYVRHFGGDCKMKFDRFWQKRHDVHVV